MIPIYVNDIRRSLENKCYFSALALALTLPDICGMVEFPNKSVAERYVKWYDKYLVDMKHGKDDLGGNNPWLSGEVVYNLRNTYLHQGNPGIASDKINEEANQLDRFTLMLGDGTVLPTFTLNIEARIITYKMIFVDVTYLCDSICDCALWYYENNQEKFKFNFNVITQEEIIQPSGEELQIAQGDVIVDILNQKLEKEGNTIRFVEDPDRRPLLDTLLDRLREALDVIFSDEAMIQQFLNGESFTYTRPIQPKGLVETRNTDVKENSQEKTISKKKYNNAKNERKKKQSSMNVSKEKREAQARLFFDKHFKEQIYFNKKEEIIQSVLKSKTKQQVNNNLMKYFTSKEVSTIYQRLKPLIKNLPGK